VSVVVEPGDHGAALLRAIGGARRSVHVTMYLLSSRVIRAALLERRAAGVDVKVVLNHHFVDGSGSNDGVARELRAGGVAVAWSPERFALTHAKCVLVDGEEAWIMTMNATLAALTANREFLARDTRPADVALAEAIFAADFAGRATPAGALSLVVAPENARERLLGLVASAEGSLDLEVEELTDRGLLARLAAKARSGVRVRIVLPPSSESAARVRALHATLRKAGVEIRLVETPYIHAKAIVVDGRTAFVGSENLTYDSLATNRELGVVFDEPDEVAKVRAAMDADFEAGGP
jgi:phosphatidylserine/phosphatidylglycerophosphate/cardiolipin synthase-like enzyme